jgi:hypothetical protein
VDGAAGVEDRNGAAMAALDPAAARYLDENRIIHARSRNVC